MSLSDVEFTRPNVKAMQGAVSSTQDAAANAERLANEIAALTLRGDACAFSDDAMRQLMASLLKLYAAKVDDGQRPELLAPDADVSATAVLVLTSALMKASNLEVFELGMWQSWSGTR